MTTAREPAVYRLADKRISWELGIGPRGLVVPMIERARRLRGLLNSVPLRDVARVEVGDRNALDEPIVIDEKLDEVSTRGALAPRLDVLVSAQVAHAASVEPGGSQ